VTNIAPDRNLNSVLEEHDATEHEIYQLRL